MGIGSFPGAKQPGRGADDPNPTSAEVVNGSKLHLRLSSVPTEECHGVAFIFKQTL